MEKEILKLEKVTVKPEEEMITVTMPLSSYKAFNCMIDYPIVGWHERDETAMARADWNHDMYPLPECYKRRNDVPRGKMFGRLMEDSLFYPGVKHKYWVYVPAQYNGKDPADLILFLDGQFNFGRLITDEEFLKSTGRKTMSDMLKVVPVYDDMVLTEAEEGNVTDMLDNLIADGVIPPTIGLFVAPGYPGPGEPVYGTGKGVTNRSVEYDTVSDWYARFIKEELMPEALKGLKITASPKGHSTVGISSGGIAGFNLAWYDNDIFGNAIIGSPSFGNIRGGNIWPSVIRTTDEKKDLRTCMCVGKYDADIIFGDWILADKDVASALNYKGYDFRLIINEMGHSMHFLKRMIPEALRWLYHGEEIVEEKCEVIKPYPLVTSLDK